MKQFIRKHKAAITGIGACLLIGSVTLAFQDLPLTVVQQQEVNISDTVPEKSAKQQPDKGMTMKEFDALPGVVENSLSKAADQLKKIDWAKISASVNEALKNVDLEKIRMDVEASMKKVDMSKLMTDIAEGLKGLDIEGLKPDMEKAMKEAGQSLKEINWDEVKAELRRAKAELEKAKVDLKGIDMDKIMQEARNGIEQAKTKLQQYKTMFTEMEKDGLIDTKKGFKLEYRKGRLFIDGREQTQEASNKYKKYIDEDDFNIQISADK